MIITVRDQHMRQLTK